MIIANEVEIETKYENFIGRQVWFFREGEPYRKFEKPIFLNKDHENQTVVIYHLKDEYRGKIGEKELIETLQEFYPTLLVGAKALNKRRTFLVNDKVVPGPEWLNENNYVDMYYFKNIKIEGYNVGGRVYISAEDLPEEYSGIKLIVCGRNIIDSKLDPFPEVKKYVGYIHADILYKDLIGDKTRINKRDNPRFRELRRQAIKQLRKILEEKGLLPKITIKEREILKKVHKVIADVLQQVPELEKYGILGPWSGRVPTYMKGDEELVSKEIGPSGKTDIPHKDHIEGVDQYGPDINKLIITSKKEGVDKARREYRRTLPKFMLSELAEEDIEAYFEGGDTVVINRKHPLYQFAERTGHYARLYHICRSGLEAIIDYLLKNREIDIDEYFKLKKIITTGLGDAL